MFSGMVILDDYMDYHLVEKQILRALFMFFKSLTRGIFACLIQTCICSNLNVALKQETAGETLPTFLECIFFYFFQNQLLPLNSFCL